MVHTSCWYTHGAAPHSGSSIQGHRVVWLLITGLTLHLTSTPTPVWLPEEGGSWGRCAVSPAPSPYTTQRCGSPFHRFHQRLQHHTAPPPEGQTYHHAGWPTPRTLDHRLPHWQTSICQAVLHNTRHCDQQHGGATREPNYVMYRSYLMTLPLSGVFGAGAFLLHGPVSMRLTHWILPTHSQLLNTQFELLTKANG